MSAPGNSAPPSDGHDRRLFDIAAAGYLQSIGATGASKKFIYNLMVSGDLPRVRIGKKFYTTRQSLDRWIVRHERRAR